MANKKIISIAIVVVIILAGIAAVCTWGFNKELRFEQSQRIDIDLEQKVDEAKIKNIATEILGMQNMVQTVEIYEEMVTIRARTISEEQKNNLVNKIKENYEFEQTAEKTDIITVPATRLRDMYKQYIVPFVMSAVLVAAYMVIRYHKKGILKVLGKTIVIPVVIELVFLSWVAIARIPVGRFTPALILLLYVASIWYTMKEIEK